MEKIKQLEDKMKKQLTVIDGRINELGEQTLKEEIYGQMILYKKNIVHELAEGRTRMTGRMIALDRIINELVEGQKRKEFTAN